MQMNIGGFDPATSGTTVMSKISGGHNYREKPRLKIIIYYQWCFMPIDRLFD